MTLHYLVAVLTTVLALGIAAHAWRRRDFGLACLALWMAALAATAWTLVASITPGVGTSPAGRLLVPLLSTPAGPLLYGYVLHASHGKRLHWAWFAPFALHLAAAIVLGTSLNALVRLHGVIWFEYAMLLAAWLVWGRAAGAARDRLPSGCVLAAATALHAANFLQSLVMMGVLGRSAFVAYAPFVVATGWTLAAIAVALLESPTLRRLVPDVVPAADDADRAMFDRMVALMQSGRPWADPGFDVGALARLLGTHPNAVSRALNRAGKTTFYDFVNGYRLGEAERLLADPRESRIKVEALGRQAGFRARSTFFKLFRQRTGLTPAEYRAARGSSADA